MTILETLQNRASNLCEISGKTDNLIVFYVPNSNASLAENHILIHQSLIDEVNNKLIIPTNWRGLNESIWNENSSVKVFSFYVLSLLKNETWANDLLESIYLTEDEQNWANSLIEKPQTETLSTLDSNGVQILAGDTVVLIKELDVKGSTIVAKRGTTVRNVRLVYDDPNLIEGKINGQSIYIIAAFTKK